MAFSPAGVSLDPHQWCRFDCPDLGCDSDHGKVQTEPEIEIDSPAPSMGARLRVIARARGNDNAASGVQIDDPAASQGCI